MSVTTKHDIAPGIVAEWIGHPQAEGKVLLRIGPSWDITDARLSPDEAVALARWILQSQP